MNIHQEAGNNGAGPGGLFWFEITRAEALVLIGSNTVVKGAGYLITDRNTVLYGDAANAFKPEGALKTTNYLALEVQDKVLYNIITDVYYYRHDNQGNQCYCESGVVFPFNTAGINNNYCVGTVQYIDSSGTIAGNFFYPNNANGECTVVFNNFFGEFYSNKISVENASISYNMKYHENTIKCSDMYLNGTTFHSGGLFLNNNIIVEQTFIFNGAYNFGSVVIDNTITCVYLEFILSPGISNNPIYYNTFTSSSNVILDSTYNIIGNLRVNSDDIQIQFMNQRMSFDLGDYRSSGTCLSEFVASRDFISYPPFAVYPATSNTGFWKESNFINIVQHYSICTGLDINNIPKSKNIKITGNNVTLIFTKSFSYNYQFVSQKLLFFHFQDSNEELDFILNSNNCYQLNNDKMYAIESDRFDCDDLNHTTFRGIGLTYPFQEPPDSVYPFTRIRLDANNINGFSAICNGNEYTGITASYAYSSNNIMAVEFIARIDSLDDCYINLGFSDKIDNLPYILSQCSIGWLSYPGGNKWIPSFDGPFGIPTSVYINPNNILSDLNYHSFIVMHTVDHWIFIYDGYIHAIYENIALEVFLSKNARIETVGFNVNLFISECNFQKV
jgi:hypothetical protein